MDDQTLRGINREHWNELVEINAKSKLYRLDQFKQGEIKLNPLERGEIGEVAGKRLLHLQCHFGMDTLSWARLGAEVTGVDFSPVAIQHAQDLSREVGVPGRFICSDIYDLGQHLDETFDIVFTSYGVLCWLNDLRTWADLAARYVKPGGFFYMAEFHPFASVFENGGNVYDWQVNHPYFKVGPTRWVTETSYSESDTLVKSSEEFEWTHGLGEIVSQLIRAGLRLEFLHEYPFSVYQEFPFLIVKEDGCYYPPQNLPSMPLIFSLKASKPG